MESKLLSQADIEPLLTMKDRSKLWIEHSKIWGVDGALITHWRTGAQTAVALKYLHKSVKLPPAKSMFPHRL
jgi:hypothetical protein